MMFVAWTGTIDRAKTASAKTDIFFVMLHLRIEEALARNC